MKVQELRQMLGSAERSRVEKAFVESYKQLKKYQKEEADILIRDILSGQSEKSGVKKEKQSFAELEAQIETFLENAKAGNYYAPNRVIPKSQRPKWRFLVKGYIKELGKIVPDSEHYERATVLLREIYALLCEACNYYLFSTEDAFRSVGWRQDELFHLLVSKTFGSGFSKDNVAEMTVMACTGGLSRQRKRSGNGRRNCMDWESMIIRDIIWKKKSIIFATCFLCFHFHWQRRSQE